MRDLMTRADYRIIHRDDRVYVRTPDGNIETFNDECIAIEWIRLDIIERNRAIEPEKRN